MDAFVGKRGWPGSGISRPRWACRLVGIIVWFAFTSWGIAAEIEVAEDTFRTGRYDECLKQASEGVEDEPHNEGWHRLKIETELVRGKNAAAIRSLERATRQFPLSVSLRLLGRDVYRASGRVDAAENAVAEIERLVVDAPFRYATPAGRVALGRYFLIRGADSRKVLDQFYDVARKRDPDFLDAHFATAELALDKQDNALAATTLEKAPKDAANDPRYHYLLARAFADDDRARSTKELAEALKINPKHVDSLLLQADQMIDSERYADTGQVLKQVLDVNPTEPRAWAYQAVLAHLRTDPEGEASARKSALGGWETNPEVDHVIGRKLSQKYRFAEGSAAQRRSLDFDPEYLPAKVQLCEDLLRLGEETEGWKLAAEVFAKDAYNVVAFNLVTLRDRLAGFRTLNEDGFVVRMDPREADLYGQRVLAVLRNARKTLTEKYGVTAAGPVTVEVFPGKKEFAVRTFGLPGADGLLGVCFGRVITANSPASQGEHPSNWESVLWHEFCHVVTLNKTHNKMPRWLSEGISVYEEERQDPAWGSSFNPRFRAMTLGDELTPLSKLSSAFLAPKSGLHLQFAYFESALAIEFLIQRFGLPVLKSLLDDLGAGVTTNVALPDRTKMSLEQLDRDFAEFARGRAKAIAPDATWEEPDLLPDADSQAISAWLEMHPKSFYGLKRLASRLVTEQKWEPAKDALGKLKTLYPEYVGAENSYVLLAAVHKQLSESAAEHAVLEELALRDASAGPAYLRLMELDEKAGDWRGVARNAKRMLAVNPLIAAPHRQLARAAERLGERDDALSAYRALAILDDTDPAEVRYRLAKLLSQSGKPVEARREVLKSLEEAPRFLESHRLLLELVGQDKPQPANRGPGGAKP